MSFQKNFKRIYRSAFFVLAVLVISFVLKGTSAFAADIYNIRVESDTSQPASRITLKVTCLGIDSMQSVLYVNVRAANTSYFTKHADRCTKIVKNSNGEYSFVVSENGYYSIYVKDQNGNESMTCIRVSNIDPNAPASPSSPTGNVPSSSGGTAQKEPVKSLQAEYDDTQPAQQVTVRVACPDMDTVQKMQYVNVKAANTSYFTKHADRCTEIKKDSNGEYSFVAKESGNYSVYVKYKNGKESMISFKVNNIDTEAPKMSFSMAPVGATGQKYSVTVKVKDNTDGPVKLKYVSGAYPSAADEAWKNAREFTSGEAIVLNADKYSFMAVDAAGNATLLIRRLGEKAKEEEFRGVWIAYYDFKTTGYTEESFREHVQEMFNNVASMNMNAVVVHVRPFSDAMYPSKYFPWSKYCSGTQGKDPGFDPLKIMVEEAHNRGLEFHAWLNPYRVSNTTTDVTTLSTDHPARIYRTDKNTTNDRNVLTYDGKLYYNPASEEVQKLIVNGIKEIVENYDVDGIHFDDYFYPSLGKNYKTNFDAPEYEAYKKRQTAAGRSYLGIADWRRENVNNLVRTVYSSIKAINPNVVYGISPGGFMDALRADDKYYVDFDTWVSYDGYIDYLCPQLYWSNDHTIYPYNEILQRFSDAVKNPDVKLYVGIAAYKAGIKTEGNEWQKNGNVLSNMIVRGRNTENVAGFILFDYSHIMSKKNYVTMKNLMKEFQ